MVTGKSRRCFEEYDAGYFGDTTLKHPECRQPLAPAAVALGPLNDLLSMLFSPDHIKPNLKANERFAAIRELVAHLVHVGRIRPEDKEVVIEAAIKRE